MVVVVVEVVVTARVEATMIYGPVHGTLYFHSRYANSVHTVITWIQTGPITLHI